MDTPVVTVVVPVYNGERFLQQALDSIAAQTFGAWEAVIVDDDSRDGSLALAQRFADSHPGKVKVVSLEHNLGVAGARNAGLAAARGGRLVVLLDQDDYLFDSYLAKTVKLFDDAVAQGRRPGIVAPNGLVETEHGIDQTWAERYWWRDELGYEDMLTRNYIMARAMFSRSAFDEVGGFDPACLTADDYDLWLRLLEAGYGVVTTREPLFVYRVHEDAQSQSKLRVANSALAAYGRAIERGAMTRRQVRVTKRRIRHYRAVRDRAEVGQALSEGRWQHAARTAVTGAPSALVAMLEHRRWWSDQRRKLFASGTPGTSR